MGAISCLGFAIFFGGLIFPSDFFGVRFGVIPLAGLGMVAVGISLDWLRDPPTFTKR
jgi:hypothetical protein